MAGKKAPTKAPNCGTRAGYKAHARRGESACPSCRKANTEYVKSKNSDKKAAPSAPGATPTAEARTAAAKPQVNAQRSAPSTVVDLTGLPEPPRYLKEVGRRLWSDVLGSYDLNAAALLLLGEACRTADRLERMAGALSAGATMWFELGEPEESLGGIPIVINSVIAESRQLQNQLRQTLGQLGVVGVELPAMEEEEDPLDMLARKREERMAKAKAEAAGP